MTSLAIDGVSKRFGDTTVLHPTDLEIAAGEFVVIVGPSGCGKSTLLRIIAGLETALTGRVLIDGRDVTRADPADRGVAMVFQSYALYPHLTVAQNIAFPLTIARTDKAAIAARVGEVSSLLGLERLLDRRPRQLSGGQRQRVAIGRAIVRRPSVLLLDEPLSNLDAALRVRMRHEFARLHQELGATMVYVTHDQLEAMTLANRIVVMHEGRIEQAGAPMELYARPATLAVAAAIGSPAMNLLPAAIGEDGTVVLPGGGTCSVAAILTDPIGTRVTLGIRPEHLFPDDAGPFGGAVELFERLGPLSFAHLGVRGEIDTIVAQLPGDRHVTLGERLSFAVDSVDAHVFGPDGRAYPLTLPPSTPVRY